MHSSVPLCNQCAGANPCKFIAARWNNFMRGPGSQKFSSFIPIFSWLDEEGSAAVPGGLRFPEYQASAPCWVGPITASLRKRGPQMEYSGVPVSQGGLDRFCLVWISLLMACRSSPRTGARCTVTSSLLICAEFIQVALFPFDRE